MATLYFRTDRAHGDDMRVHQDGHASGRLTAVDGTLYFAAEPDHGSGVLPPPLPADERTDARGGRYLVVAKPQPVDLPLANHAGTAAAAGTLWFAAEDPMAAVPLPASPATLAGPDGTIHFATAAPVAAPVTVRRGAGAVMELAGTLYLGPEEPVVADDIWAGDDEPAGVASASRGRPQAADPDDLLPVGGTFYFRTEEPAGQASLFGGGEPPGSETVLSLVRESDESGRAVWKSGGGRPG